jgi:threonyl-tRNA synthetase
VSQSVKKIVWNIKRNATRFKTVEVALIRMEGHRDLIPSEIVNMSKTGAALDISKGQPIPKIGEIIQVRVSLASVKKKYLIIAKVARIKQNQIGIRFISKEELDKE